MLICCHFPSKATSTSDHVLIKRDAKRQAICLSGINLFQWVITNVDLVILYILCSIEEKNMQFSKDLKVNKPFIFRLCITVFVVTTQSLGSARLNAFERSYFCSQRPHFFDQIYNKNSNILKHYFIQSSVSHDPSEIFLICWFGAQKTFLCFIFLWKLTLFSGFFDQWKIQKNSMYLKCIWR